MTAEVSSMDYLFEIKNTLCARTIRYWAKLEGTQMRGAVYWWMTDHVTGPLNAIERSMAYGFSIKSNGGRHTMTITSLKSHPIELVVINGAVKPVTMIQGRRCVLERIFVVAHNIPLVKIPKVDSVDIFGKDCNTNEDVSQRIKG